MDDIIVDIAKAAGFHQDVIRTVFKIFASFQAQDWISREEKDEQSPIMILDDYCNSVIDEMQAEK